MLNFFAIQKKASNCIVVYCFWLISKKMERISLSKYVIWGIFSYICDSSPIICSLLKLKWWILLLWINTLRSNCIYRTYFQKFCCISLIAVVDWFFRLKVPLMFCNVAVFLSSLQWKILSTWTIYKVKSKKKKQTKRKKKKNTNTRYNKKISQYAKTQKKKYIKYQKKTKRMKIQQRQMKLTESKQWDLDN